MKWVQFRRVNNFGVKIVQKVNNFDNEIFPPFSKLFIQSSFYLQNSQLFHSLVRVGRFFLSKLPPPANNFDKKVIFNDNGLDIKLLNIKLLIYIGLDFSLQPLELCTFGLSMFIFEKNPKNLQKPIEYTLPDGTCTATVW